MVCLHAAHGGINAHNGMLMICLQEVDPLGSGSPDSLLNYWEPEVGGWVTACQSTAAADRTDMLLVDTARGLRITGPPVQHGSDGVVGCSVQLSLPGTNQPLSVFNVHMRWST